MKFSYINREFDVNIKVIHSHRYDRLVPLVTLLKEAILTVFSANPFSYILLSHSLVQIIEQIQKNKIMDLADPMELDESVESLFGQLRHTYRFLGEQHFSPRTPLLGLKHEIWFMNTDSNRQLTFADQWQQVNPLHIDDTDNQSVSLLPIGIRGSVDATYVIGSLNLPELILQFNYYQRNNPDATPISYVNDFLLPRLMMDWLDHAIINRLLIFWESGEMYTKPTIRLKGIATQPISIYTNRYVRHLAQLLLNRRLKPQEVLSNIKLFGHTNASELFAKPSPPYRPATAYRTLLRFKQYGICKAANKIRPPSEYDAWKNALVREYRFDVDPYRSKIPYFYLDYYRSYL